MAKRYIGAGKAKQLVLTHLTISFYCVLFQQTRRFCARQMKELKVASPLGGCCFDNFMVAIFEHNCSFACARETQDLITLIKPPRPDSPIAFSASC
jgi:hypothetical protein